MAHPNIRTEKSRRVHRAGLQLLILAAMQLLVLCVPPAHAANYLIREIISVRPGEQQTREFLVNDRFNLLSLAPVEGFIVYSWALTGSAGELSLELSAVLDDQDGQVVFSALVAGSNLNQEPVLTAKLEHSPNSIKGAFPINSTFGIFYIGVLVHRITGDLVFPIPFRITFSVSEGTEEQAEQGATPIVPTAPAVISEKQAAF